MDVGEINRTNLNRNNIICSNLWKQDFFTLNFEINDANLLLIYIARALKIIGL